MTWKGTLLTVVGFERLLEGYGVSSPVVNSLGVWECQVGEARIMAKTLIELARSAFEVRGARQHDAHES